MEVTARALVLILATIFASGIAHSGEPSASGYNDNSKHGWFWYKWEAPAKEEEKNLIEEEKEGKGIFIPDMKDYTHGRLMTMHPDEFQPLMDAFLKKTVQDPSLENAEEYQYIKEIARVRAANTATALVFAAQVNPGLDASKDYPVWKAGRVAYQAQKDQETASGIAQASQGFGLLYFYKKSCPYCDAMYETIGLFTTKYGWSVAEVDTDKKPDVASRFGVDVTPYVVVVSRDTGKHVPVTAGAMPLVEFETRLYRAVRFLKGEPVESLNSYRFQEGGGFDSSRFRGDGEGVTAREEIK